MSVWQQFTSIEPPFQPFAEQHAAALIVFAVALAAALWCARTQSYQQNLTLTRTVALFLFFATFLLGASKMCRRAHQRQNATATKLALSVPAPI